MKAIEASLALLSTILHIARLSHYFWYDTQRRDNCTQKRGNTADRNGNTLSACSDSGM